MTSSMVPALPMQQSEIIAADPELKQTLESVNHWCERFMDFEEEKLKKQELSKVAGHIQLACKFLSIRLKAFIQKQAENSPAKSSALKALRQVHGVSKWIGDFPVVQELYRWGPISSLNLAVDAALPLYENLIPEKVDPNLPLHELNAPMERLVECKRVWDNISRFCKTASDTSVIKMKEVRTRLTWLEQQIERQKSRDLVASPKAIEISRSTDGKRPLEDPEVPPSKRKHLDSVNQSGHDAEKIMSSLQFGPKLSPCLSWIDMAMIDTSNVSLLTSPPALPTAKDLVDLATGQELTDLIIDPYMALLCHYGNGHFDSLQTDSEMPGSPKWHAWSTWFADQIKSGRRFKGLWPPKAYPGAKIGDVMYHVIPIFLGGNHWGMAILSNTDGTRRLDFYSSLTGYEREFEKIWLEVASWLMDEAKSDLGLQTLPFNVPKQPLQNNMVDCGVFICCELRWLIEAWPLQTLLPENIPKLRRRMVVELEKWSLSV